MRGEEARRGEGWPDERWRCDEWRARVEEIAGRRRARGPRARLRGGGEI
jgi:hypothetical protein